MKTVADIESLKKMASRSGGEVFVGGKKVGAQNVQPPAVPKPAMPPAEAPPKPAAPAPAVVTVQELQRLLDARDAFWSSQIKDLEARLAANPAPQPARPSEWVFTSEYDSYGRTTQTIAKPVYRG